MPCKVDDGSQKNKDRKKEREHDWVGFVFWAQLTGGWVVGRLCLIAFQRERMLCAAWWDEDEGEVSIVLYVHISYTTNIYIHLSIYLSILSIQLSTVPCPSHPHIPTSPTPPLLPPIPVPLTHSSALIIHPPLYLSNSLPPDHYTYLIHHLTCSILPPAQSAPPFTFTSTFTFTFTFISTFTFALRYYITLQYTILFYSL